MKERTCHLRFKREEQVPRVLKGRSKRLETFYIAIEFFWNFATSIPNNPNIKLITRDKCDWKMWETNVSWVICWKNGTFTSRYTIQGGQSPDATLANAFKCFFFSNLSAWKIWHLLTSMSFLHSIALSLLNITSFLDRLSFRGVVTSFQFAFEF